MSWSRFSSAISSRSKTVFRDGSFEIIAGSTILGVFAWDQYLQYNNDRENYTFFGYGENAEKLRQEQKMRENVLRKLRSDVESDAIKQREALSKYTDDDSDNNKSSVVLFQCIVRKIPPMFDGTMSLKGLYLGDVVNVLEENVGPDRMYHLCKIGKKVGWFPISHLEKMNKLSP